jgi:hypothetical protein
MEQKTNRYSVSPGALSNPASKTYLGNREVVVQFVGRFAAQVEELVYHVASGRFSSDAVISAIRQEVERLADIFSGRNPEYSVIKGYHDNTLGIKLKVDLGSYWLEHRHEYHDDPVAVLFDWLGALVIEKVKLARGDDIVLEVMLGPSIQYAVDVLLDVEKRRTS